MNNPFAFELFELLTKAGALHWREQGDLATSPSGRQSCYELQFKDVNDAQSCLALDELFAKFYQHISQSHQLRITEPVFYGPPSTGTLLARGLCTTLAAQDHINASWASWYKAAKAGANYGADLTNQAIIVVEDDVISGQTLTSAWERIQTASGKLHAVLIAFDAQEQSTFSAPQAATAAFTDATGVPVYSMANSQNLLAWLEQTGQSERLTLLRTHLKQYGVAQPAKAA